MKQHNEAAPLLAQAVAYFHAHPGLGKLLNCFADKYRSLGRLGGIVTLEPITPSEKAELEAFFRKRLPGYGCRITAAAFVQALAETKFGGLEPLALLAAWQGEALYSRKERQAYQEAARRRLLTDLLATYPQQACQLWLNAILAREPAVRPVQLAWRRDKQFRQDITLALQALGQLPAQYMRLPVFAREVCGDPHALDIDSGAGKLFLNALRYSRANTLKPAAALSGKGELSAIEEISELLYMFRLLREDIMNYVTCMGLAAYEQDRELAYWRLAAHSGAPLNVPLREIVRAVRFAPAAIAAKQQGGRRQQGFAVFLVENSGVFSTLLDELALHRRNSGTVPLICLQGQLNLAAWTLLDGLVASGAQLHYSGDFDPEGLQIAEKLLLRYPDKVQLWRMDCEAYFQAKPAIVLEPARLHKLHSVKAVALTALAGVIAAQGLAAYQEGILARLAADLLASCSLLEG